MQIIHAAAQTFGFTGNVARVYRQSERALALRRQPKPILRAVPRHASRRAFVAQPVERPPARRILALARFPQPRAGTGCQSREAPPATARGMEAARAQAHPVCVARRGAVVRGVGSAVQSFVPPPVELATREAAEEVMRSAYRVTYFPNGMRRIEFPGVKPSGHQRLTLLVPEPRTTNHSVSTNSSPGRVSRRRTAK